MSNSVDTQTIQPRRHMPTSDSVRDEDPLSLVGIVDQTPEAPYSENTSRLSHLYSHCRESCTDPAGLRIIAASALVVGLMLSSAPAALAQVRLLLTTTPATFSLDGSTRDEPARDGPTRDDPAMITGEAPGISDAQHRSTLRSAMALIRWHGTSQALKCAYGLLFEGNTRACQNEPVAWASSQRRLAA
ncbi:MAG: hypothetical protein DLM60_18345 [Pseudonocardiales bacterium]|nr:MAG: hypothetical protein DLM60_18345 [Pseudonocardiales bacterium]